MKTPSTSAGVPGTIQSIARTRDHAGLQTLWSIPIGGGYQKVIPINDGTDDLLLGAEGGVQRISRSGKYRWKSVPFGSHGISGVYDLDDDGRYEIVTSNGRELLILSADNGSILFRTDVGPPYSYGTYAGMIQIHRFFPCPPCDNAATGFQILVPCFSNKEILMFDCSQDVKNTRLMHRFWMDDSYHPSIVIGDVNSDGIDEIVVARYGGIYVFEPINAKLISQTQWNSDDERRRNYGHFELADIDGDGELEAIIISDKVTRHIAVLDNDGNGSFHPLWDRFVQHIYPIDSTELRATANALSDVDGDGRLELTVSLYNDRGDARWYTEILDPRTGKVRYELPDQYLRGILPFSCYESNERTSDTAYSDLCTSFETDRTPAVYSPLSIYSIHDRAARNSVSSEPEIVSWRTLQSRKMDASPVQSSARFAEWTDASTATRFYFKPELLAAHGVATCTSDHNTAIAIFAQQEETAEHTESLFFLRPDRRCEKVTSVHRELARARLAYCDEGVTILSTADGKLYSTDDGEPKQILQAGYPLTPEAHISARIGAKATFCRDRGMEYIIVPAIQHARQTVDIYRVQDASPILLASLPGRGMLGYDNVSHHASTVATPWGIAIPVIDDEALPHSRMSLYALNGEKLRSYEWSNLPHSVAGTRIGCYQWTSFQHSRGPALLLHFYRSQSMNSECTIAMLIESAEELWSLDNFGEGDYGRGAGPWGNTEIVEKSGQQIAIFCAKDTLCEIDLETGSFYRQPKLLTDFTAGAMRDLGRYKEQDVTTHSSVEDPFTAYGSPMMMGEDLVIGASFGGFGVLNDDLSVKWWKIASFGDVLYRMPGVGDIDGDGKLELGQCHGDGVFRIYDFESGALRAEIDIATIGTDILVTEINGQVSYVTGTSDGRILIIGHDGREFAILQELSLGAGVGSPVAYDIDQDSFAEIFVASADGVLTCLKVLNA